jgi:hypothetical protein
MYLPVHCTFRMTDIWRSFIAQRCLWEVGCGLVFHMAEVCQARNTHNLLSDFSDEISGYVLNDQIVGLLNDCPLESGAKNTSENLRRCYRTLCDAGILPAEELPLVNAWLEDVAVLVTQNQEILSRLL